MKPLFLLFALLASGCHDPFAEAKEANTIDAFEKFLKENPSDIRALDAKMTLEPLYIEKARASKDPADFDVYLDRFKNQSATPAILCSGW